MILQSVQLSPRFSLAELTVSQEAARRGITLNPPPDVMANLTRLCVTLLEPIRMQLGRPVIISSGWRPAWLNDAIGGAPGSAHLTGRAADINAVGMSAAVLAKWIRANGFQPDKVICEFGRWVHIQIPEHGVAPRNEYLTASRRDNRTVYEVMA